MKLSHASSTQTFCETNTNVRL